MEEMEEMSSRDSRDGEVLVDVLSSLLGLSMLPIKLSAGVVANVAEAVEKAIPEPEEIKSCMSSAELSVLRALKDAIERRIEEIEKSTSSEERRESVKVE